MVRDGPKYSAMRDEIYLSTVKNQGYILSQILEITPVMPQRLQCNGLDILSYHAQLELIIYTTN